MENTLELNPNIVILGKIDKQILSYVQSLSKESKFQEVGETITNIIKAYPVGAYSVNVGLIYGTNIPEITVKIQVPDDTSMHVMQYGF